MNAPELSRFYRGDVKKSTERLESHLAAAAAAPAVAAREREKQRQIYLLRAEKKRAMVMGITRGKEASKRKRDIKYACPRVKKINQIEGVCSSTCSFLLSFSLSLLCEGN